MCRRPLRARSSPPVAPGAVPSDTPVAPIARRAAAGISQLEFESVLAVGREKGQLTQAELIEALHTVELTPEVLTALIDCVTAEGVALVEDEEEDPIVEVVPHKEPRPAASLERRAEREHPAQLSPGAQRQAGQLRRVRRAAPRTPSTPT